MKKSNLAKTSAGLMMLLLVFFVSCESIVDNHQFDSSDPSTGSIVALSMHEGSENGEEAKTITLYAGQDMDVGAVNVSNDDDYIYVEYVLNEDAIDEGWCITETHVHVGTSLTDFPLGGRWGNPAPGQFDYKNDHDPCVEVYQYEIPIGDWEAGEKLLIGAHAAIEKVECETLAEAPYPGYKIVDYDQGLKKDKSPVREGRSDPEAVLTYDLGQYETNFFSLGFKFDEDGYALDEGGWIIVEFDCPIKNGEGNDIMIVEDTWGTYPLESAKVYVSQDGKGWFYLGEADNTARTVNNIHTESYFNLDDVELEWVKFVKVVDTTPIDAMPNDGDGFDLNTIVALHDCIECITYDETAWGAFDVGDIRFTEQGNWATYFTYIIGKQEYILDITSVNNNTGFTHTFTITYNPKDGTISGTGDSHAGTQTLSEFDYQLDEEGIISYIKFRSDYDATSYFWFPAFNLKDDGTLEYVDVEGDNVFDAEGTWEITWIF